MKFCSLYSGSSGNSLFFSHKDTRILVDAGLSGKRIEQALCDIDELPAQLSGILVTHEHRDHIHGVGVLSRRYDIPVYANAATWGRMEKDLGKIKEKNRCLFETEKPFAINDLGLKAFRTSHDAVESVGFVLENGAVGMGIATDTGIITDDILEALKGCELVVLESNHDPGMLETGRYPFPLKQRIKGNYGHLSNETAGQTACTLVENGVKHLVLGHLSQENNYPLLAYQTTAMMLKEAGIDPEKDIQLDVARRSCASGIHML